MARKKKDASVRVPENFDIDVGDVTAAVMPEGVPMNPDGSVADSGEIGRQEARKMGAVDASSAQHNRRVARTAHKKLNGQSDIRWNEQDALFTFDNVKKVFDPSTLWIYIQRKDPGQADEDYKPVQMTAFKDSPALYDHVLRTIHKSRTPTTYLIRFKDTGGIRGQGFLRMPDTSNDHELGGQGRNEMGQNGFPMQFPPIPLPNGGFAPNPYAPSGYPFGFQQPPPQYPYPPQPQGYPPQAPPQNHPQDQHPPQQPPQAPPQYGSPQDQYMYATMATTYQESRETKEKLQRTELQIERLLGELAEMRRNQQYPQAQLPMGPYGPQVAPNGSPYGAPPAPAYGAHVPMQRPQFDQFGNPLPPQPPYQAPQGYPQNGAPQPVQAPGWGQRPVGVAQPPNGQQMPVMQQFSETMGQAVSMIGGMTKAMAEIQRTVGAAGAPPPVRDEFDDDDDLPNIPPPPPNQPKPFHTMPLGIGEAAPVYAYNEDGTPNMTGMILGNLPKAGAWLQGLGKGVQSVLQAQRSAQGNGTVGFVPEPQQPQLQSPLQRQAPVAQTFQPSPRYVEAPQGPQAQAPEARPQPAPRPQAPSMVPSMSAVRTALNPQ